jgi:carboxypeptidase C (cathepsin A)
MMVKKISISFLFVTLITTSLIAKSDEVGILPFDLVETKHSIRGKNGKLNYTAVAGDTELKDSKGKPKASIFSTAYFRSDVKNTSERPLIFVFNGGPGSSSVWLHLGVFGPKIVQIPSDAQAVPAPPYTLKDNALTLLDIADMVFIDPVGTGYSTALGEYEGKDFWGVRQDAEIMSDFVRQFITKYQRWNSPKYLAGESYGTTRAAVMVKELQEGWGSIDLNGVFLISSIVDFQAGDFNTGNDLPFITFLPTYAATAWYHNALPNKENYADLPTFIEEVRTFAMTEYASALILGQNVSKEAFTNVVDRLHEYTGLSKKYLEQTNLRIDEMLFMKELLRDRGLSVGRLDSRYLGVDASNVGARFDTDPSSYAIDGAYTAAMQTYLASDLNILRQQRYNILSGEVFSNWDWLYEGSARSQGYLNTGHFLSRAQRQNPSFRIFIANGYYDLATPFFATEYSFSRSGFDTQRITMKYYESGHMMYIHHPSLKKLADDMRAFLSIYTN